MAGDKTAVRAVLERLIAARKRRDAARAAGDDAEVHRLEEEIEGVYDGWGWDEAERLAVISSCCTCGGPAIHGFPMCTRCRVALGQAEEQWCALAADGEVLSRGDLTAEEAWRLANKADPELKARAVWVRRA